jgi:hypothetical protein
MQVEGLARGAFDGHAVAIDDFHCDLVGAAIEVLQREHRAASRHSGRLAVEQQAIAMAGQQRRLAGDGDDDVAAVGAQGCVRFGEEDAQ